MRALACLLMICAASLAADKVLQHDSGDQDGKASRAGTGHLTSFEAPKGSWWVKAVRVHGSRYGGGYDPATTKFRVTVCDSRGKALTITDAPYDLFKMGRFEWVEVTLEEPIKAPRDFKVVVAFEPTATRGVYVGWSTGKESHSALGLPGGPERAIEKDRDWMIRAVLSKKQPKGAVKATPKRNTSLYRKDFDFLARTVRTKFPALEKKGIDWKQACKEWRPRFLAAENDKEHLLNVHQLLALLKDSHTGVTESSVEVHVPSFDGLYGAGMWIAVEPPHARRLVLRALMPGHALEGKLQPGAELLWINGRPAKLVLREVRARCKRWHGWSSDHFLDARLSFQFFPFGDKRTLPAVFLNPDGEIVEVELQRWGPGGRGLSRIAVTLPEGVEAGALAVATRLDESIGYVRICGGMNDKTRDAFFEAFDTLRDPKPAGIILDCRGMGGGGDAAAWAMAGRFFSGKTKNGTAPPLMPTGEWQYDGPVTMLIDEREISSAETFTWAMVETGRAVTVGRPTGGATIIPTTFRAPSGLFSFRMGVHDRKTPIEGRQPEGIGTDPTVFVPYEPGLLKEHRDPTLAIGLAALRGESPSVGRDQEWAQILRDHQRNPLPDYVDVPESDEYEAQSAFEALLDVSGAAEAIRKAAKAHPGTRWGKAMLEYAR